MYQAFSKKGKLFKGDIIQGGGKDTIQGNTLCAHLAVSHLQKSLSKSVTELRCLISFA